MGLDVTYKGNQIASLESTGTIVLNTKGKFLEDDISITEEVPQTLIIDLSSLQWEPGAVGGETDKTYEINKQNTLLDKRVRVVNLVETRGIPWTLEYNTDNGRLAMSFQYYNKRGFSATSFTISDNPPVSLASYSYTAFVLRPVDSSQTISVSDIAIAHPVLTFDISHIGILFGGD